MKNNIQEILRIKNLMGLKKPLKEGMYRINKLLLNEDTGAGEIMKIYEKLFAKTTQQLDETEQVYLKNFIDEYNQRFGDEFGNINFTGKIDGLTREAFQRLIKEESDDVMVELFSGAIKRIERFNLSKESFNIINSDELIKDFLKERKVDPENMFNADGEPLSALDILIYINRNGGDLRKADIIPLDSYDVLKSEFQAMMSQLPPDNPISKNMSDIIDQIDEIETGELKVPSPEEVADIVNNLPLIEKNIINPKEPIIIDATDDWTIDLSSGDDIGLGGSTLDARKEAINKVMEDMEKKCKVGFCKTMVAYWKKDNKKFEDMWSYIYNKLADGIKPKVQSNFNASVSQGVIDEYQLILKEFGKKDTPFTPDDYIKLGEEIYKKMKDSNQLGVFGGVFTPFKDMGVFTSKDMMYRTLGYVALGSDPFKGGWTFKGMWDRWWKLNLIWFPVVLTHNIIESGKGSEDPTSSSLDQFVELMLDTAKDTALLGFAPGPRAFLEGGMYYINQKVSGSKYVDYPTLINFLNSQHGWTENQIYDNLINKGYVRTFRDATPPYTLVSGATDVYAVSNGKYEVINKTFIGGLIKPKVVFTPEGATKPDPTKDKTAKIDREARTEIKKIIGDESFISDSIGKNMLGNKKVDFDRQETLDENGTKVTLLIYKVVNSLDKNAEVVLNYDAWVAAGKPELKSEGNWNKYVKVQLL
jgi:hypothetical protein